MLCLPFMAMAQTEGTTTNDRVAALQAEATAKAKAAQEAALAAQEAARAAQEAAEAAAQEAKKLSQQPEIPVSKEVSPATETTSQDTKEEWTTPAPVPVAKSSIGNKAAQEASERTNEKLAYLEAGAVPEVDGKVQWKLEYDVPGQSAQQIYETMLQVVTNMTQEKNQLERSKVVMVNEGQHKMVATFQEWLVFTSTAISLDRTKFNYLIQANCTDGHLEVILDHVHYNYAVKDKDEHYKAEDWITDKYAVNKKRTRLYPISGKFRRKTIDRKNEIFEKIKKAF